MKKLSALLILAPIFLITALNFNEVESDFNHPIESRAFTCTSCHATIIDGIIVGGGKVDLQNQYLDIAVEIPVEVSYNGVSLNVSGVENFTVQDVRPFLSDDYGKLYNLDISSSSFGKKENTFTIKYPITDLDRENGSIEIQGVISNLDGTNEGDYSFYKKIEMETSPVQKEVSLYPSVSNSIIFLDNLLSQSLINIYNTSGQIVYSQVAQSTKESVDVSEFQKGNYFVSIQNEKTVSQSKFIVSK